MQQIETKLAALEALITWVLAASTVAVVANSEEVAWGGALAGGPEVGGRELSL